MKKYSLVFAYEGMENRRTDYSTKREVEKAYRMFLRYDKRDNNVTVRQLADGHYKFSRYITIGYLNGEIYIVRNF